MKLIIERQAKGPVMMWHIQKALEAAHSLQLGGETRVENITLRGAGADYWSAMGQSAVVLTVTNDE
jgi:hypothetical protein